MINSIDEATKAIKQLCVNYSDDKLKDVLLFYFNELRKSTCPEHSPTPEPNCEFCRNEHLRLEAFRGIATIFEEMNKMGSGKF